jgi:peroxiredoxin
MKYFAVFLVAVCCTIANAQNSKDSASVIATAMDYADGYYSGNAARMEQALYPDINKGKANILPQTGKISISISSYSGLIEGTRAKAGTLEESKRKLSTAIIQMNDEIANVRVRSAKFNDYVQMVKSEGQWKIINVLWTDGLDSPKHKESTSEEDHAGIVNAAEQYMNSMLSGDTKRLEAVLCPEYNKVSMTKDAQTGKLRFQKQKYSSLVENCFAKAGLIDETKRIIRVRLLDCMDNIAVVEIETRSTVEYAQIFKTNGGWNVFNALVQPNTKNSFLSSLPAIVGFPMPEFSLPVYGGGEFTLSKHKGKNVLLIFLRGWTGNGWCDICQYGYADLVERENLNHLQKKFNLDIAFVLPYTPARIADFLQDIPDALGKVEKWKNPAADASLRQQEVAVMAKKIFRKKYAWGKGQVTASLPILVDSERVVSRRLQLFTTFWDQINAEQNIPAVFILDPQGNVLYKYISQTTLDRPTWDVLEEFLKKM